MQLHCNGRIDAASRHPRYSSGLDIPRRRQGPQCLLHAASSFHVDYRIYKNKSVVCNVLFLNLLGALLAVSRSITLTTSITIRRRSPAEGGQAHKPVEFSLRVASPKSKISRGLPFQEFGRLIPLQCNGITWRQQNHTVPVVIS